MKKEGPQIINRIVKKMNEVEGFIQPNLKTYSYSNQDSMV